MNEPVDIGLARDARDWREARARVAHWLAAVHERARVAIAACARADTARAEWNPYKPPPGVRPGEILALRIRGQKNLRDALTRCNAQLRR